MFIFSLLARMIHTGTPQSAYIYSLLKKSVSFHFVAIKARLVTLFDQLLTLSSTFLSLIVSCSLLKSSCSVGVNVPFDEVANKDEGTTNVSS